MSAPQRIVLRNTTKMTLNDRFSTIKTPPPNPSPRGNLQSTGNFGNARGVRQRLSTALNVSRANKRLALQMENRPAVMAALKLKKKSLKQRLGNPFKNTLLLKAKLLAKRGRGRGRGFRGRGVGVFRGRIRANFQPKGRGEVRGGRGFNQRGGGRPRGRGQGLRGRGSFRGRGRGRGGRGGRGRGRGGAKNVTREDLDKELDQYMGSTKSALDHELDAYMSEKDKE